MDSFYFNWIQSTLSFYIIGSNLEIIYTEQMMLKGMGSINILIKIQNDSPHKHLAKHLMTSNYISSNIFIW